MNYYYYQTTGGDEVWKPIPEIKIDTIADAMYRTILSVDTPVASDATKEQLAAIKYKGPLYFDLDDAHSPASTAVHAAALVEKLEKHGVLPSMMEIYASGGKGYHIMVPEECFLTKPPKTGIALLPATFKEMAFDLAVNSMDMRVYTARKGRMIRQPNVLRPNGMYKVRITWDELQLLAAKAEDRTADGKMASEDAYRKLCSQPRRSIDIESDAPELAVGLLALFDQCKAKVTKASNKAKKAKVVQLPAQLPSFEALLRGEGLKPDVGFHKIAMQVAITAHAKGMSKEDLLTAAVGLCRDHVSDGNRYDTEVKRRNELERMWDYTDDNPCYEYSPAAIIDLLNHQAPDLRGLEVSAEEIQEGMDLGSVDGEPLDDYEHAGLILTKSGAFSMTETGPKRVLALGFENVTELVSTASNTVSVIEADMTMGGKTIGRKVLELDNFNSTTNFNRVTMPYGQSFSGNDQQARGLYMRLVQKARKSKNRMYAVAREGLDLINLPFHEDEEVRKDFLIWSDVKSVTPQPNILQKELKFKFVGFPSELGHFQTDLSQAPSLPTWIKDDANKELLRSTMFNLLHSQKPEYFGKLIGWMVACHYRMLFHKLYSKFPMLHINGAAGAGKTEGCKLLANMHYYYQEPKMLTPTSTLFAVQYAASGSASIPLILDEFKPSEMAAHTYDRFKLMLRDAYNCRSVERGGGTRENSDYRSVHSTALSAPICFIAEAAESESALMERVVLLTLVKPPVVQAQKFFHHFSQAVENKHVLGIVGSYMAAQIVQRYSLEKLNEEFMLIYNAARKELMLQEGESETLGDDEIRRKSAAKERTVYNYSVVKFGLQKLSNLLENIFPGEFKSVLDQMMDGVFSTIGELQQQTVPEWLKVFNAFADMTRVDGTAPYYLKKGVDYVELDYGGETCIELYARSCYMKYRMYSGATRSKPLFPSEAAFVHAIQNLPSIVAAGHSVELTSPGGSHIFSLNELRKAGFLGLD